MLTVALVAALFVRLTGWVRMMTGPRNDSTYEAELLSYPPVTKPRARILALVPKLKPPSCRPPPVRVPAPKSLQGPLLVEASKVVRQTSGEVPLRCQESHRLVAVK